MQGKVIEVNGNLVVAKKVESNRFRVSIDGECIVMVFKEGLKWVVGYSVNSFSSSLSFSSLEKAMRYHGENYSY